MHNYKTTFDFSLHQTYQNILPQSRIPIFGSNGHIELPQNLKWIKANLGGGGYYRVQYPPEVTFHHCALKPSNSKLRCGQL